MIALDRDPAAPGFQYADRRAIISTEDEQGIAHLADAEGVEGIIAPGIDWPVAIAARVAERMGLPHPIDGATAGLAVSKQKQRERLERGRSSPAATGRSSRPRRGFATRRLPTSWVVKAPDRQGQKGLALVRSEARASGRDRAGDRRVPQRRSDRRGPRRRAGGDRQRLFGARRVPSADRHRPPDRRPAGVRRRARPRLAERGRREGSRRRASGREALGIENGPTYTQLRIGPKGPQVIEVAARLGEATTRSSRTPRSEST